MSVNQQNFVKALKQLTGLSNQYADSAWLTLSDEDREKPFTAAISYYCRYFKARAVDPLNSLNALQGELDNMAGGPVELHNDMSNRDGLHEVVRRIVDDRLTARIGQYQSDVNELIDRRHNELERKLADIINRINTTE